AGPPGARIDMKSSMRKEVGAMSLIDAGIIRPHFSLGRVMDQRHKSLFFGRPPRKPAEVPAGPEITTPHRPSAAAFFDPVPTHESSANQNAAFASASPASDISTQINMTWRL